MENKDKIKEEIMLYIISMGAVIIIGSIIGLLFFS